MTRLLHLARFIAFGLRMLRFDLLYGRRSGLVGLGKGTLFTPGMRIRLGAGTWIGPYSVFKGTGSVSIGAKTYIGAYASLNAVGSIEIGERCMFGNFVSVIDNDHGIAGDLPYQDQPLTINPVVICDDCWIGEKATILNGVTVGAGAIVAAGAVVREDVAPRTIVGGVPARVLRDINAPPGANG